MNDWQEYKDLYDKVYEMHPAYSDGHGNQFVDDVVQFLAKRKNPVIADCGCGRNQFLSAVLKKADFDMTAYGLDVHKVEPIPEDVEFVQAPAWAIGEIGLLDVITSFDVLEHLHKHDILRTLVQWYKHLKPAGRVYMSVCMVPASTKPPAGIQNLHFTVMDKDWWINRLVKWFNVLSKEHDSKNLLLVLERRRR